MADAPGRTDRLREFPLQRAVGVRRQPGAGRGRPADRRRPARGVRSRQASRRSAARGVRGVPARRRRRAATSSRSRPRAPPGSRTSRSTAPSSARTARRSGRCGRRRCAIATRARWPARARRSRTRSRSSASCSGASRATGRRCATTRTRAASALIGDIPIFVAHDSADVWAAARALHLEPIGRGRRWSPACRPTTSARPASAGATRSTAGIACGRRDTLGGSRASAPPSSASTPSASITSSASPATGRSPGTSRPRSTDAGGAGPGAHFFKAVRRALREDQLPLIAEDLGVVTPEVKALRDDFGLPGHQDPAVRVRHRSERARLPAPQLPAQRRRLHRHARQRHDRRLVPRSGQRHAQRRTDREGAADGARLPRPRPGAPTTAAARSTGR